MLKWFEYALAMTAVVFLLMTTPLYASSLGVGGVSYYSINVVSSNDLEAHLNYSFVKISETSWIVNWRWVSEANRKELNDYREGKGELPKWVQRDSADSANDTPVTSFGFLVPDKEFIDETKKSGSFGLTLDLEEKKGKGEEEAKIKVGLHSVVIQVSDVTTATGFQNARRIVTTTQMCGNVVHSVFVVNGSAYYKQSFDDGASWLNLTLIGLASDDSNDTAPAIAVNSLNDLQIVFTADSNKTLYFVEGISNGLCGWSFTSPLNISVNYVDDSYAYGYAGLLVDSNNNNWVSYSPRGHDNVGGIDQVCVKTCRSNCNVSTNWNATNSSAGDTCSVNNIGIKSGLSLVGDSTGNVFSASRYNTNNLVVCKFTLVAAGNWSAVNFTAGTCGYVATDFAAGYSWLPSLAINSSDSLFVAYTNYSAKTTFGYCSNNCESGATNWFALGGASSGLQTLSVLTASDSSVSVFNDKPFVVWATVSGLIQYVYANTSTTWSSIKNLTTLATKAYYPSAFLLLSRGEMGLVFTSNTSVTTAFEVVYSNVSEVYIPLIVSIILPVTGSYANTSLNTTFFFVSEFFDTANCSSYLDGVLVDSTILSNYTNYSSVLSGYGFGLHSFSVKCFNGSTSVLKAVSFTRVPFTIFLSVSCFDEATGSDIVCDSVTVSNSTNSSVQTNAHSLNFSYPTGSISVTAANASFYTRIYPFSWNASFNDSVNVYLLNASLTAIFVRFHVSNAFSQPVNNASILIQRSINGSSVVVSSLVTDSYGLASDYLELNHPYTVLVYASGYNVYVSSISPVVNDYYITLVSSTNTSIPVYDSYELGNTFSDVYWNLEPNTHSLTNETTNIVFSVVSPGSTLHYFGMNVSYANGSNICFENVTNSSAGGVVSCLVLMDNTTLGDNVSVIVWISRSRDWVGDFIYWYKREAGRYANTLTDFYDTMSDSASGADSTAMAFIVIVIATIAGLWVYQYHKTGALLVMLAILWLGAAAQFMNVNLVGVPIDGVYLMAFITVAVVGINFLREKI